MKLLYAVLVTCCLYPPFLLAETYNSGRIATGEEYDFRFSGSNQDGDCKFFNGPPVLELFKESDSTEKVAEFIGLKQLTLCKIGSSKFSFRSVGYLSENMKGYSVSKVNFRFIVKDKTERRVGGIVGTSPSASTNCKTKRMNQSPLRASVSERQYNSADTISLFIGKGDWRSCEKSGISE